MTYLLSLDLVELIQNAFLRSQIVNEVEGVVNFNPRWTASHSQAHADSLPDFALFNSRINIVSESATPACLAPFELCRD